MKRDRFFSIVEKYPEITLCLVGDFCLDRYLEINSSLNEISIETDLTVYNVTNVRAQPGGAGTILNNLQALGIGKVIPSGFVGKDGEGAELMAALEKIDCVDWSYDTFIQTEKRRTFTYCKPLLCKGNATPKELNRFDFKNWDQTPNEVTQHLCSKMQSGLEHSQGVILLDQVDAPDTGVIQRQILDSVRLALKNRVIDHSLSDSRKRIIEFEGIGIKVNKEEFSEWHKVENPDLISPENWEKVIFDYTEVLSQPIFVSLSEHGIIGKDKNGAICRCKSQPIRGEIDIVGAGDCTTANLILALAAGAQFHEAMEIAMAAASVVIHKLGTTGTASVKEIEEKLFGD